MIAGATNGNLGGTTTVSEGGRLTYTPSEAALDSLRSGESATETFNYRVVSGGLGDTATVTITLVGTNEAPTAAADASVAVEDSPVRIDVLANDKDPDGDSLTIVSIDESDLRGSVTITADGKELVYQAPDDLPEGRTEQDTFRYEVSDGQFTDFATVTVEVTGRNDPPVAITDPSQSLEIPASNGPTVIPLDAIFVDADLGDELAVVSIDTALTKGTVTIGSIIYDPGGAFDPLKPGEVGVDQFVVTAVDSSGATKPVFILTTKASVLPRDKMPRKSDDFAWPTM